MTGSLPRAQWLRWAGQGPQPAVAAYAVPFAVAEALSARLHVAADEWCELYLDGTPLGRMPDRGDAVRWFYTTVDLTLSEGTHVLAARVWALGAHAPAPVMSIRPGLWVATDADSPLGPQVRTGEAVWRCKALDGFAFGDKPSWSMGAVSPMTFDGAVYDWSWASGPADGWNLARAEDDARLLQPTSLPPMYRADRAAGTAIHADDAGLDDARSSPLGKAATRCDGQREWQRLSDGHALHVPANARRRAVFDLGEYVCAFSRMVARGGDGAVVRMAWAEALRTKPFSGQTHEGDWGNKTHRDRVDGMYFHGIGDTWRMAGGGTPRAFESYWWRPGRFIEVVVETAAAPLVIERLSLRETRYPLELDGMVTCDDEEINESLRLGVRALQMCAHDTYMDCPYYEQQQWVGDMRPQILCGYVMTLDDRLPRQAMRLACDSADEGGLTRACYPNRGRCVIPSFCLWLVTTLHDYARWRGDRAYVAEQMPAMRALMQRLCRDRADDGLMRWPGNEWNYYDWVDGWERGIPPHRADGVNGLYNWQIVYTLDRLAELEAWLGATGEADAARALADDLSKRCLGLFWDDARGAMADDPARTRFSQHTQSIAVLTGRLPGAMTQRIGDTLAEDSGLTRCNLFFTHYLFEAFAQLGRIDLLHAYLMPWRGMVRGGVRTTFECWPQDREKGLRALPPIDAAFTRSDCHAWSAHPLYHLVASVAGIQPAGFGFERVRITPRLGPFRRIRVEVPHPKGTIAAEFEQDGRGKLSGNVRLPEGLEAEYPAGTPWR